MKHSIGSRQDFQKTRARVTLRGPAELADALPYLLGYHPDDSIVLVGVHGDSGRFGGRLRLGIPSVEAEWPDTAEQLADCLLHASKTHAGEEPDAVLLYLCREPSSDKVSGREVVEQLRPLAQALTQEFAVRGRPIREALCISAGRYFSYVCADQRCCAAEGTPLGPPGASELAAATTYVGLQTRGSLRELTSRLTPWEPPRAARQEYALHLASAELFAEMLTDTGREEVRARTLRLAARLRMRYLAAGNASGPEGRMLDDVRDDAILTDEEAAQLLVGLQDRGTRDRAAEWMEGQEGETALRLWRALCRRSVGGYAEYAATPLTLVGWVAWSGGDEPGARVALLRALELDPQYAFARLLHSACNRGLDPEPLRKCLRRQRADYERESLR